MIAGLRNVVLAIAIALGSVPAGATDTPSPVTVSDTNDLGTAIADAEAAGKAGPGARVLLVFDIDNTLLTMPQFLGSDQWFNYHAAQIAAKTDPYFTSFNDLIGVQSALFGLGSMQPTQPDAGALVGRAQASGADVFLLSARGPDLFDVTERELGRNGIAVRPLGTCSLLLCSADGAYGDADIRKAVTASGVAPAAGPYRGIVIRSGLLLGAGQNKGTMLRVLLAAIGAQRYSKIVFVDDTQANIDAVAASGIPIPLALYHYTRITPGAPSDQVKTSDQQLQSLLRDLCPALRSALCPATNP